MFVCFLLNVINQRCCFIFKGGQLVCPVIADFGLLQLSQDFCLCACTHWSTGYRFRKHCNALVLHYFIKSCIHCPAFHCYSSERFLDIYFMILRIKNA